MKSIQKIMRQTDVQRRSKRQEVIRGKRSLKMYVYEKIEVKKPIRVLAHCHGKVVEPLRIEIEERVLKVTQINLSWREEQSASPKVHYFVILEDEHWVELVFDLNNLSWKMYQSLKKETQKPVREYLKGSQRRLKKKAA